MVRFGSILKHSSTKKSEALDTSTHSSTPQRRQRRNDNPHDIPDAVLIPLLAQKSYHLPGNSWREDWVQWMRNNHIVFGICFCNRLHPIEWWERIIVLLGSMSFALIALNIYYLLWVVDDVYYGNGEDGTADGFDPQQELYSVTIFQQTYAITAGTVVLWTFGGLFHSIWDFTVWQMSACACFHPGGRCYDRCGFCSKNCNDLGSYVLIPVIAGVMGLAIYSSYLRVHDSNNAETATDDLYDTITQGQLGQLTFLAKYAVELFLAWFFYFPLIGSVMFSGILGCGKLPILGGRPRDKATVEKELAEHNDDGLYASF